MPAPCSRGEAGRPCRSTSLPGGRLCAPHWDSALTARGERELTVLPPGLTERGLRAGLTQRELPHRPNDGSTREILSLYDPPRRLGRLLVRVGPLDVDGVPGVRIHRIETAVRARRTGVASLLYELFRLRYPEAPVDHGVRSAAGQQWWANYCRARGLDPHHPLS